MKVRADIAKMFIANS